MPQTNKHLPVVKRGDPILASDQNDLRRQVNALGSIGGGVHILANSAGVFLGRQKDRSVVAYVGKVGSSPIAPREGDVPGSATVSVYGMDSENSLAAVLKPDGSEVEVTVYNISDDPIPEGSFVMIVEEDQSGRLVAVRGLGEAVDPDSGDGEFPPGWRGGPCCGNCKGGVTIADAEGLECCESHLEWAMLNPWLNVNLPTASQALILKYIGDHVWLSDPFTGPDCDPSATTTQNEYRWKLTIDVDGVSYLDVVLETDNGCDALCLRYWMNGFNCLCENKFVIDKPHGYWAGLPIGSGFACSVCLVPGSKLATLNLESLGLVEDCGFCGEGNPYSTEDLIWVGFSSVEDDWGEGCGVISGIHPLFDRESTHPEKPETCWRRHNIGHCRFDSVGPCQLNPNLRMMCDIKESQSETPAGYWYNLGFDIFCALEPANNLATVYVRLYDGNGGYNPQELTYQTTEWDCTSDVVELTKVFDGGCNVNEIDGQFGSPCCRGPSGQSADPWWQQDEVPCSFPDTCTLYLNGTVVEFEETLPTYTGACEDEGCTDTAAPTDPDDGCCCFLDEDFPFWDESLCTEFGGVWYSDCAEAACNPLGACCLPSGDCIYVGAYYCGLLNGTAFPGEECEGQECEGACCRNATEGCVVTSPDDCTGSDYFFGIGTTCVGKDCLLGACCRPKVGSTCTVNDDCTCDDDVFSTVCDDLSGEHSGGDTCATITACNCAGGICRIPG